METTKDRPFAYWASSGFELTDCVVNVRNRWQYIAYQAIKTTTVAVVITQRLYQVFFCQ